MTKNRWVQISIRKVLKETAKAFLCDLEGQDATCWFPKSQIREPDELNEGDEDIKIEVPEWFCEENELEG